MIPSFRLRNALVAASMVACGSAFAAPTTFFGEDLNNSSSPLTSFANSNAARDAFLSNLTGVGTETFESRSGSTPLAIVFPGAGTATLNGSGEVTASVGAGRFPISGTQFWNADTGNFSVDFTSAIAAFGFYGIDVGDYGASLSLELTAANGDISTLSVPLTIGSGGSTNGSVLFFGFIDTATSYTKITFRNSGGGDIFGFDDMTIGVAEQVVGTVPTPGSLALVGAALLAFGAVSARRKSRQG